MNPLCRLGFLSFFSLEVRFCPCYNAFGDIHYFRLSSERFWQVPKGGENSKSGDGATRPWVRIPPPPPAAQRHLPLGCSISINTAKSPGDAVLITREGLVRIRNATVLVLFVLVPGFAHRRSGIPPPPPSPNPHETQCSCGFSRFWGCFSCSNLRPRYRFLFAVFPVSGENSRENWGENSQVPETVVTPGFSAFPRILRLHKIASKTGDFFAFLDTGILPLHFEPG